MRFTYLVSALIPLLLTACTATPPGDGGVASSATGEAQPDAAPSGSDPTSAPSAAAPLIGDEPCHAEILLDADGDVCNMARSILSRHEGLAYHYQRVGCCINAAGCDQEFVTYAAVQYPHDSLVQVWMADVLSHYYYDVTRQLDIAVNGERTEYNADGELVLQNDGCRPYQGVLDDEGKTMFDYYQARVWVIGRDRGEEHGPAGRYGCAIYRCWQSSQVVTYWVGYSTDDPQWPVHQACSLDRSDGHQLDLTEVVREDCIAELYDLMAEEARARHRRLLRSQSGDLAIEAGTCDYASMLDVKTVALTAEGLAISTGALAFDQWASASHILIIPYHRVNHLLEPRFRR